MAEPENQYLNLQEGMYRKDDMEDKQRLEILQEKQQNLLALQQEVELRIRDKARVEKEYNQLIEQKNLQKKQLELEELQPTKKTEKEYVEEQQFIDKIQFKLNIKLTQFKQ